MKTRLDTAKEILAKRMSEIDKTDISYESPLGEHKRAILSDIFYDIFLENPTKEESKWLDDEDREYSNWEATEAF